MRANLANIDMPTGGILPPGTYYCSIYDAEEKQSNNGSIYWRIQFRVNGGDYDGRIIRDSIFFSDAALPRFKLLCVAMGMDGNDDREYDFQPKHFKGKKINVEVELEDYVPDPINNPGVTKKGNKVAYSGFSKPGQPQTNSPKPPPAVTQDYTPVQPSWEEPGMDEPPF